MTVQRNASEIEKKLCRDERTKSKVSCKVHEHMN
jgi:hypothetical protein